MQNQLLFDTQLNTALFYQYITDQQQDPPAEDNLKDLSRIYSLKPDDKP